MKRRAGVKTDQELARFLGAAQSTVSNWRQRGGVPEAALLKFEEVLATTSGSQSTRALFAKCVALRLPEVWHQRITKRSAGATREVPYLTVATSLNAIVAEIADQMARIERDTGLSSHSVMKRMLDDDRFLSQVIDWLNGVSASELLYREFMADARAREA